MSDRIIDLSETPARLSARNGLLAIEPKDREPVTMPLAEVGVLILAHPQISCTLGALAGLTAAGAAVIACDDHHLPAGLMLPIQAHFSQTERFTAQAAAALPVKKRLWKQIVREKIRAQAALLRAAHGEDCGLTNLFQTVRSGDPSNVEAQAARRYWNLLFRDDEFHRRRDANDQNRFLNYGYAVLRALVGRAVCAAGLHPSLGLHHHNRYNPFCLADDLMEPYRPLIDSAALECVGTCGKEAPIDRKIKEIILGAVIGRYRAGGEVRTLFDFVARTASSLAKVFLGETDRLFYPEALEYAGD